MKTYKNTTITKDIRGYFTALVYTRDRVLGGYYFQPIQADSLSGAKELINHYRGV